MPSTHVVAAGDTLISIAKQYGFRDWRTIWEHADNAALRELREFPSVVQADDEVAIPEKVPGAFERKTGNTYAFTVKSVDVPITAYLRLQLKDGTGEAFANSPYSIDVDGEVIDGSTDAEGVLEENVPVGSGTAKLTLSPDGQDPITWQVELSLDPIDEPKGVQQRLNCLGFGCAVDGDLATDESRAAVKAFQADNQLDATGEVDSATRIAIRERHESA